MNKQIFILNGTAGAGKDTFAGLLNECISTKHISSITPIKKASEVLGWSGEKTPEYRKFLCEFKKFLNSQGKFIWNYLDEQVKEFNEDNKTQILLIDIREPEEIEEAVKRYKAKTIFISNSRAQSNAARKNLNQSDLNVQCYRYDYIIKNDGSMNDFRTNVKAFAEYISPSCRCSHCMCQNKEVAEIFEDLISIITKLSEEKKYASIFLGRFIIGGILMKSKAETVILVDMDDVMIDLVGCWVEALNKKYDTNVKPQDITDWQFTRFFPSITPEQVYEPLTKKDFWKSIEPIDQAATYLKMMRNEGYQIYVCTSTNWKNVKYKVKYVLNKYFDFISWENVIITGHKQMIKADFLIDDGVHNLRGGDYKKLLFSKPHNKSVDSNDTDIVRVNNWKEVYNYISVMCGEG